MSIWAIFGLAYLAIWPIEIGWFIWDYNRKSPQVDVTGDVSCRGVSRIASAGSSSNSSQGESSGGELNAPSPFDSRLLTGNFNSQAGGR